MDSLAILRRIADSLPVAFQNSVSGYSRIQHMLTQEKFRGFFDVAGERLFLNHAAYAPLSRPVIQAMNAFFDHRRLGNPSAWAIAEEHMEGLRENFGKLINSPSERIALMQNTVTGLNVLASGLTWNRGDHILLYEHEFPSNVMPFLNLREQGVEVEFVKAADHRLLPECFENALRPNTRLVSVSSVQYLTGYRADLKQIAELCHANGTLVSVDGIQSLGVIPEDVMNTEIDFLAVGGHKWLMAPLGAGFLYLTEALQSQLKLGFRGYMGHVNPVDYDNFEQPLSPHARRYELGAFNAPSIVGAQRSTELLLECGIKHIHQHVRSLIHQFEWGLAETEFNAMYSFDELESSGICMFTHQDPNKNKAVFEYLSSKKVNISLRGNGLRLAPHYYNNGAEIDQLLDLLLSFR